MVLVLLSKSTEALSRRLVQLQVFEKSDRNLPKL